MRKLLPVLLVLLPACNDPVATLRGDRWTMRAEASDCWPSFSIDFALDANGIGHWQRGGRVVADGTSPTWVAFYPLAGGRKAEYRDGAFRDPHGVLTEGGACVAAAELVRH